MIRINKFLSEHGYCSRREADDLIATGRVFINGKRADLGQKINEETDDIRVQGRAKRVAPKQIYLLCHKPPGIITTTDRRKKNNILDFVDSEERVFPVGRLDVASSGLILLTNDGVFADRLMHPRYEHEKEYVITVDTSISRKQIKQLADGILLADGKTLPAKVRQLGSNKFAIILREGKNRQIRRMCSALGFHVVQLIRTRILTLKLGTYPEGRCRDLTQSELSELKKAIEPSTRKKLTY